MAKTLQDALNESAQAQAQAEHQAEMERILMSAGPRAVEERCVVDGWSREIAVPERYRFIGIESDEKVVSIPFVCPKMTGNGTDMSEMNIYINYMNAAKEKNRYLVEDVRVEGDNIVFSWVLSRHVTQYKGFVEYIICAKKSGPDGNITNEWNSKVAQGIVGEGFEVLTPGEIEEHDHDIIEQILIKLGNVEDASTNATENAKKTAQDRKAVEAIKTEVIKQKALIDDTVSDFTTTSQQVKADAVKVIQAEGTKQVQAVTAEGTKQKEILDTAAQGIVADREQIQANKESITELQKSITDTDILRTVSGETIVCENSAEDDFHGFKVFGRSTQNGEPSSDTQVPIVSVGDKGNINLDFTGRNLIPNNYKSTTHNGITYTVLDDGSVLANGTAAGDVHGYSRFVLMIKPDFHQKKNLYLSGGKNGSIIISYTNMKDKSYASYGPGVLIPNEFDYSKYPDACIQIQITNGTTANNVLIKPMLNVGDSALPFEPYKEPQSLTLSTPNGLPGVKADSDGNYTDKNGQQWICDERDYERGKYVQRIGKFIYDGSIDENWVADTGFSDCIRFYIQENKMMRLMNYKDRILCNRLKSEKSHHESRELCITGYSAASYSYPGENWIYVNGMNQFKNVSEFKTWLQNNPLEVYILLQSPIEHDLTPEEIAAYKALHTNNPTTVISNDESADMEVTYAADTNIQRYVRSETAEINARIDQILEDNYPYTYGFIEHMDILSPSNRIEYVGINKNFTPMTEDLTAHITKYGSWGNLPTLVENKPYMVKPTGEADYELNQNDYTKKLDGTNSDVANTAYDGGAFSKFVKVYVKRWIEGNDRHVRFSYVPIPGFEACGFYDTNDSEMDYVWLPMFYGSTVEGKMRSLSGLQPDINQNTDTQNKNIIAFSNRAAFFGGAIIETIRDMLYMLFKTTDIQAACGKGNSSGYVNSPPYNGVLPNAVVGGGQFYGSNTGKNLNKIFHSIVLGSYNQWQRDPYYLVVNGRYKVSTDYTYDITGAKYIDTGIDSETVDSSKWIYPSKSKVVPKFGSIPIPPFNASTATGYCDGVYHPQNKDFTAVVPRFGGCADGVAAGPGCLLLTSSDGGSYWNFSASVLLRPPAKGA